MHEVWRLLKILCPSWLHVMKRHSVQRLCHKMLSISILFSYVLKFKAYKDKTIHMWYKFNATQYCVNFVNPCCPPIQMHLLPCHNYPPPMSSCNPDTSALCNVHTITADTEARSKPHGGCLELGGQHICAVAGKVWFHWVVLGIFQQNQYSATMENECHWAKAQSISKNIMGATVAAPPFFRASQGF